MGTNLIYWRCIALAILAAMLPSIGCKSFNRSAVQNSEGVTYYTQGQYDLALPYFQEAARLDPNNSEALYNMASTYQQQAIQRNQPALLAQAENYYRACLDRNPSPETTICCYRGIATAMTRRNQGDQAVELLKGWESRNPSSVEPKLELAYLYEAQNKPEESLKALESATPLAPNDYRVYYKKGVLQQKLGKKSDALNQYLMAGRLRPGDREIAGRISTLQMDPEVKNAASAQLAANLSQPKPAAGTIGSSWQTQDNKAVSLTPPSFAAAEKQTAAVTPPAANTSLAAGQSGISHIPTTNALATQPPVPNSTTANPLASPNPLAAPTTATNAASTAPKIPDGTGTTSNALLASNPRPTTTASPLPVPVKAAAPAPTPVSPTTHTSQVAQTAQQAQATPSPQTASTQTAATPGELMPSARRSRVGIVGNGPPLTHVGPSL